MNKPRLPAIKQTLTDEDIAAYCKNGYGACPYCGSTDIVAGQSNSDADYVATRVDCNNCEAEWDDVYRLLSIEPVMPPKPGAPTKADQIHDKLIALLTKGYGIKEPDRVQIYYWGRPEGGNRNEEDVRIAEISFNHYDAKGNFHGGSSSMQVDRESAELIFLCERYIMARIDPEDEHYIETTEFHLKELMKEDMKKKAGADDE